MVDKIHYDDSGEVPLAMEIVGAVISGVKTMADGGIRLTLDLPELTAGASGTLMTWSRRRSGIFGFVLEGVNSRTADSVDFEEVTN